MPSADDEMPRKMLPPPTTRPSSTWVAGSFGVAMISALFTAQVHDDDAGQLHAAGAGGGPDELVDEPFYIGINDNFGDSQTHAPF